MRRPSQVRAYREIVANGLLTKRRQEVYAWLFNHGSPATANEVARGIGHRDRGATSCRLGELRDLGVVYEVDEAVCPLTGMTVLRYDVTDNLPSKNGRWKVREILVSLVFMEGECPSVDESAAKSIAGIPCLDFTVTSRVRNALDLEVALINRRVFEE